MNKKFKKIDLALATAACTLVGLAPGDMATAGEGDWDFKTATLYYSEADRINLVEAVLQAKKKLADDSSLSSKFTLDTLTGASANGAVPGSRVQTFTRPSGRGSYTISAGDTPLDDTFQDTRVAINGAWEKPISRLTKALMSANLSKEFDFFSGAVSGLVTHDFNQRNTTLSAGLSYEGNIVEPEGGIPTSFGQMQPEGEAQPRDAGDDTQNVIDLLLGVTQVIDRNSLFQVNYGFSQASGYLSDPYKVLSVVDATSGEPIFLSGSLPDVRYEKRPDSRAKHSIFGQYKRNLDGDVLDVSYRYMLDDWDISSHTLDLRYRWAMSAAGYLQPHLRYYQQNRAEFHQGFLVDGEPLPEFASADYRLGDLTTYTVGLEYGRQTASEHDWRLSFEYYLQAGEEPEAKFGALNDQELCPDVKAVMVRFNYDF